MGFPSVCYCVLLPGPLVVFLQILDLLRLFLASVFHFLGLSDVPVAPLDDGSVHRLSSAELPYLPVGPASIKRRLPVVRFSTLRRRLPTVGADGEPACAVCLCGLEGRHEVRLLGNCGHTFHRSCIDRWVDLGQMTCPLCRSRLLPRDRCSAGWWSPFLPSTPDGAW